MKLQTPDHLESHPLDSHIKKLMLGGQKAQSLFAHDLNVSLKVISEDLKVLHVYLSTASWVMSQWYAEFVKIIKSTLLHLDRLYTSTKNLYDILNAFLRISTLLRDLIPNPNPETLSVLNMTMNELAQQINLEQTTHQTIALQFKDSVKSLEANLGDVYKTLEPTIDPEAPVLVDPAPAESFMSTSYSPYLELSINEIVDSLYKN